MSARVVKVILSDDVLLGKGDKESPLRRAISFYSLDGDFLGSIDPLDHEARGYDNAQRLLDPYRVLPR